MVPAKLFVAAVVAAACLRWLLKSQVEQEEMFDVAACVC